MPLHRNRPVPRKMRTCHQSRKAEARETVASACAEALPQVLRLASVLP